MPEVHEVRQRGLMVGIDLGEHDPDLRLGHRVVLEARRRGVIVRPLGEVIVLMPPLSISKQDLKRLVQVVGQSIRAAYPVAELDSGAKGRLDAALLEARVALRRTAYSSYGSKSALRAPQTGQNQSSGMSSNAVPGGTPPSGSPSSGS